MTCTYAHMQLRSPVQDITHTNTHAFKKKTGEKPTHSTKQLTEVMTLRGPQGKGRQHCTVPHPLFTDTVPRTEKAALDQKRASEIASQQVCRETSASSSASSAALTPAPLPRKKACETPSPGAPVRRTMTGLCTESSHGRRKAPCTVWPTFTDCFRSRFQRQAPRQHTSGTGRCRGLRLEPAPCARTERVVCTWTAPRLPLFRKQHFTAQTVSPGVRALGVQEFRAQALC